MGLRDDLQADLADAFNTDLSDAVTAFTGTRTVASDTDDGIDDWMLPPDAVTDSTLTYSGRGVFDKKFYEDKESATIQITDVLLTCLQNEITEAPYFDDKINGYRVITVTPDPANTSYDIQLRQV
ncbi:glutamate 5-kinase [Psychrobacter sp. BI730]|uniref:glutamate 5-kinase n=1 Tax=Psychrobacter sp. BI730 TaxID=2705463 RepID=UPI0015CD3415|nr:glutamate 5-kinase [Psychrobacter sp. BI730]NYR09605.1 glutamate 5-kinase [Psychrobacter sp. BI730]